MSEEIHKEESTRADAQQQQVDDVMLSIWRMLYRENYEKDKNKKK